MRGLVADAGRKLMGLTVTHPRESSTLVAIELGLQPWGEEESDFNAPPEPTGSLWREEEEKVFHIAP